ncbi:Glycogen phosphorylase [Rhodopirellula islandica]|uniref:Glycogen phosphorylase n=1 Tax=Rhodopirellula islandica TaxID=595434 RepID=A0A0J1EIK1_RHOIS|nr:alpha-glucan family phosphorylase [Rhodopirellula islandica]KLU05344.1 Glycogen phosphorylase [Rhodopirellula islandica]
MNMPSLHDQLPTDIDGFDLLAELSLDLRSTWNHATDEIWRTLDAELWEATQNPWVVLQAASHERIEKQLSNPEFRERVNQLVKVRRDAAEAPGWFQQFHAESALKSVAYFSMEYMLSEALPIYSGGLGNVAGDQLKAASDLGVPATGIGLLYQQGYFRQAIDADGAQQALYPYNDPGQLPVSPLRTDDGEWLRLKISLPGHSVWLRAWKANVGRVKLYLLDSNDPANLPVYRSITSELYGGGPELRLMQEMVLGIGGWRLLKAVGVAPDVCHLNEGHAAFAVLERARDFMDESGQAFDASLAITRAGNLFTTHTAVAAGFDRFDPRRIEQYLGRYAREQLGIGVRELLALGRLDADDDSEPFNMAYLAVRGSGAVNGVSRLHGEVSRQLFEPLFPHWPEEEVPITHVTNGVHVPTWDSAPADALWTKACGQCRWRGTTDTLEQDMRAVTDEQLWGFRLASTHALVDYARSRLSRQLAGSGASPEDIEAARHLFDPAALTLGFARRFATYKRPNLLLHEPDRLLRLLSNSERPVQLIIAGKAHPADQAGQDLIRQWIQFIRRAEVRPHVIFISDYDMLLTQHLVRGVDVWLNTPRRPWEASGTSGMKVLVNGGLNLSELDGWWAEAYSPDVGWAIGDGKEHGDDPQWDAIEANQLYELLENEVVPEYYDRNELGIPSRWLARMRESMARLTPRFSAVRTVCEYTEKIYIPAANRIQSRTKLGGVAGTNLVNWKHALMERWSSIRFVDVAVTSSESEHHFVVQVDPGGLEAGCIRVEMFADAIQDGEPERLLMNRQVDDQASHLVYELSVPSTRPANDYTARILPQHEGVAVPLELPLILWQR